MESSALEATAGAWPAPGLRRKLLGLGMLAWMAVLASVLLRTTDLAQPAANLWPALACVIAWVAAFFWNFHMRADRPHSHVVRAAPVVVQAGAALAAFALLQDVTLLILLVVVAAQLPGCMQRQLAYLFVCASTLTLFLITLNYGGLRAALTIALAFLAFQGFALFLALTLVEADQARAELAASNTRLLATQALLQDSVRDRERLRIARELHDLVGHKLTALQLNLQVAARTAAAPVPAELGTARDIAAGILSDIRNVIAFVPLQAGVPLESALTEMARSFPGSLVRVEVAPQVRIEDMERAQSILRCAQEATSNAIRHGRATQIVICVAQEADRLTMSIVDDGTGFRGAEPGFGLASMGARVRELGGEVTLQEAEPRGAAVRIVIPVQA